MTETLEEYKARREAEIQIEINRQFSRELWNELTEAQKAQARKEMHRARNQAYNVVNAEQLKAYQKAYRIANPEKVKAQKKAYHIANPEKVKAYNRAYCKTNAEKVKATKKAYREANAEREKAQEKARRARKKAEKLAALLAGVNEIKLRKAA